MVFCISKSINTYQSILGYFGDKLYAREIRFFSNHKFLNYKINFDEFSLSSPYDALKNHYYIVDLKGEKYIAYFEIEIQPHSEMIISLK